MNRAFGWFDILRLGLVQACLGAVVVMTTSTLNRVMVVELALPALLPGLLVALHYLVQVARPRMGYGSDMGHRRTPWIVGGMAVLAAGGVLAALATAWIPSRPTGGIALAVVAFVLIGLGVSASGTSLLVLLAKRVPGQQRAAAATLVWLMMIVGFAVTAGVTGQLLDPFSPLRLIAISAGVSLIAMVVTVLATHGLEGTAPLKSARGPTRPDAGGLDADPATGLHRVAGSVEAKPSFLSALTEVWSEPIARRFTIFIFVSMLAYSAQDLILEPFAGTVLGFTPGESTSLSGIQHAGVLLGMISAVLAGRGQNGRRFGSLRAWQVGGCLTSALMLLALAASGFMGRRGPSRRWYSGWARRTARSPSQRSP
jgi:BCD family chlorophyll transporter-like MFS transporter